MINQTFDNKTWRVRDSQGKYRSIPQHELICAARQCAQEALCSGPAIESALDAFVHLQAILGGCDREVFAVLLLNQNHKILTYEELFVGTVNAASVHPREVVRLALQMNASAIILAHNHPTGSTKPSSADRSLTCQLQKALALIEVEVLDHIIVGEKCLSFAQDGLL